MKPAGWTSAGVVVIALILLGVAIGGIINSLAETRRITDAHKRAEHLRTELEKSYIEIQKLEDDLAELAATPGPTPEPSPSPTATATPVPTPVPTAAPPPIAQMGLDAEGVSRLFCLNGNEPKLEVTPVGQVLNVDCSGGD